MKRFETEELKQLLLSGRLHYWEIYFAMEPLEEIVDKKNWYLWRKKELIQINYPIMHLITDGKKIEKYRYSIECCSEYIEAGQVKAKSEAFCKLVQEFLLYSKERLN